MAKDKKRGFFSWLGFGQKEEEQQQPEPSVEQTENQAVETPAEPVAAPLDDKLPARNLNLPPPLIPQGMGRQPDRRAYRRKRTCRR